MSAYLKVIGSGDAPLPGSYAEPYADFPPSRPPNNISKGDFLVLYAAGWKRIFAVVRVIRMSPRGPDPRWPHRLEISYIYNVSPVDGVFVNDISEERELTRSIRQQTCISLRDAEFKQAWEMLKARQAELEG